MWRIEIREQPEKFLSKLNDFDRHNDHIIARI